MSVWALVPVKPLLRAKSRLAETLTPKQRSQLAETMLRRTLSTVQSVAEITGTLVISRDSHVLALARDYGVNTIQESGTPELNNALNRATGVLSSWKASVVLILPADIPLVNAEDIQNVVELGRRHQTVVLVTDRAQDGTNVLLSRPPGMFNYAYGPGSFQRHEELARQAGMDVKTYNSERLALDIDTPEDLAQYRYYVEHREFGAVEYLIPGVAGET
jgi:2-phospho-L-lactate guanylyltransferase